MLPKIKWNNVGGGSGDAAAADDDDDDDDGFKWISILECDKMCVRKNIMRYVIKTNP